MKNRAQLDLFVATPDSPDPLFGLTVQLPDGCNGCGALVATIAEGVGPHTASLRCAKCDAHCGWLPRREHQFITEIVSKFGRPQAPITIRRGRRQP